ncbi:MAG: hypothetical protein J2P31_10105 [Blastocatellia bacterium]|nr:hypothetical protein [Blastocatellia bacterium]
MTTSNSLLSAIEEFVNQPQHRTAIDLACDECEAELRARPALEMNYRVVIPGLKETGTMSVLHSLWVFAFAPGGESDIHKHSNSTQYTRAWRGAGSMRIGDREDTEEARLPPPADRKIHPWVVIPPGTFHHAVAGAEGWCVVSFQTAPAAELQDEPYEGEPHYYLNH